MIINENQPSTKSNNNKKNKIKKIKGVLSIVGDGALELVKDAVILIKITQLGTQVLVNVDRVHRLGLHGHIPDL
jgi:hypothetical protein